MATTDIEEIEAYMRGWTDGAAERASVAKTLPSDIAFDYAEGHLDGGLNRGSARAARAQGRLDQQERLDT